MKTSVGSLLAVVATLWLGVAAPNPVSAQPGLSAPATAPSIEGDWIGNLSTPTATLRLAFHIHKAADGTYTGTMDSLDQGAKGIPLSAITIVDGFSFDVPLAHASYRAHWDAALGLWAGTFTQGAGLPLALRRGEAASLNRPQTPKPPFPYRAEEVGYGNPVEHNHLAGTLTLPPGKGPFPAALLITGSGLQDRDETIFGHKPFLVLANDLTRRGIAVLRVDDRTMGGSTGDVTHATSADFATDVEAGIAYLKSRPEIDPREIGLIGHSEGGLIAPMVAARDPSVAWIVMMAGPGLRGDQIMIEQKRLIEATMGLPAETLAKSLDNQRQLLATVEHAPDGATAKSQAEAFLASQGMTGAAGKMAAAQVSSDWFRYFLSYDPVPALRKLRIPVLAVDGSLDLQVPPKEDLAAIKAALAGDRDVTVIELPGLNHLFQTAKTGSPAEYGRIEETLSPAALKTIGDWVVAHTR
jgi:pimeloyl-ACP methyl ester carboxylesterase